ncbi:AarF/UbiB family protein [Vibrio sp. ZSDE26]|uniref:AarF/UbiB family protein n=1 Tax=Vibrio amylolyticus TaxID=2847292 RepID=A0A9X2BMN9_9VIBR|nr:AarF/UbiB family protein [Vibrio amylolyticus]MCK6265148.1 AarF/UbiB family protein [Vibrio amylolyticus]
MASLVNERYRKTAERLISSGYRFKRAYREHVYLASSLEHGDVIIKFGASLPSRYGLKQSAEFLTRVASDFWSPVIEYGSDKQIDWLILPYICGQTVSEYIINVGHDLRGNLVANKWLESLELAISTLHKFGFVHGDIKPSNILITSSQKVLLLDFSTITPIGTEMHSLPFQFLSQRYAKTNESLATPNIGQVSSIDNDWYSIAQTLLVLSEALQRSHPPQGIPSFLVPSRYQVMITN